MDMHTVMLVGAIVAAVLVGAVGALHQVAPLTETKVDDKMDEYAQKGLPFLVRVLDYLRARSAK